MANVTQFNRQEVLSKVTEVFQRKGFSGTSMQDLVDVSKLNRSSLYNSFGSKSELFYESINYYYTDFNESLSNAISDDLNGFQRAESMLDFYIDQIITDEDSKGCMIMNCKAELASSDKTAYKWLKNNENSSINFLEKFINFGQNDGSINKNLSSKEYALFLLSSIQGLRSIGILNKNLKDLNTIKNTILNTIK